MINRIIPLLLFIGFVWGQADLDKLVLKDGTTYFGEYSKTEGKIVYFKPQDTFAFQPVSVKLIKQLQLKDGHYIIGSNIDIRSESERQTGGVLFCVVSTGILVYLLYLQVMSSVADELASAS